MDSVRIRIMRALRLLICLRTRVFERVGLAKVKQQFIRFIGACAQNVGGVNIDVMQ